MGIKNKRDKKPYWEGKNTRQILQLVQEETDQGALADVAKYAKDKQVRLAALKRITDDFELVDVAKESGDGEVGIAAVERITNNYRLADIAVQSEDGQVGLAALERITSDYVLADIAEQLGEWQILERITDDYTLIDIAIQSEDGQMCLAAVKCITDNDCLAVVAYYLQNKDPGAAVAAVQRITDAQKLQELLTGKHYSLSKETMAYKTALERLQDRTCIENVVLDALFPGVTLADSVVTSAEEAAEQTEFDVIMTALGDQKVKVIKEIITITGLSLLTAKELVESAPVKVIERIPREAAETVKAQLEAVGATVEIKEFNT